jgi:hypothetical protein
LSTFKFQVHHIRGTQNVIADALSRMNDSGREVLVAPVLLQFPILFEDIATHQRSDPDLSAIIDRLSLGDILGYSLEKGILHCKVRYDRRPKIVIPPILVPALFAYFHDSPLGGHLGIRKTIHKIRQSFIWKGMDADIAAQVRAYRACGLSKQRKIPITVCCLRTWLPIPWRSSLLILWGKFPYLKSGNAYALVCVDVFTKLVWIFPIREVSTATVIRSLD